METVYVSTDLIRRVATQACKAYNKGSIEELNENCVGMNAVSVVTADGVPVLLEVGDKDYKPCGRAKINQRSGIEQSSALMTKEQFELIKKGELIILTEDDIVDPETTGGDVVKKKRGKVGRFLRFAGKSISSVWKWIVSIVKKTVAAIAAAGSGGEAYARQTKSSYPSYGQEYDQENPLTGDSFRKIADETDQTYGLETDIQINQIIDLLEKTGNKDAVQLFYNAFRTPLQDQVVQGSLLGLSGALDAIKDASVVIQSDTVPENAEEKRQAVEFLQQANAHGWRIEEPSENIIVDIGDWRGHVQHIGSVNASVEIEAPSREAFALLLTEAAAALLNFNDINSGANAMLTYLHNLLVVRKHLKDMKGYGKAKTVIANKINALHNQQVHPPRPDDPNTIEVMLKSMQGAGNKWALTLHYKSPSNDVNVYDVIKKGSENASDAEDDEEIEFVPKSKPEEPKKETTKTIVDKIIEEGDWKSILQPLPTHRNIYVVKTGASYIVFGLKDNPAPQIYDEKSKKASPVTNKNELPAALRIMLANYAKDNKKKIDLEDLRNYQQKQIKDAKDKDEPMPTMSSVVLTKKEAEELLGPAGEEREKAGKSNSFEELKKLKEDAYDQKHYHWTLVGRGGRNEYKANGIDYNTPYTSAIFKAKGDGAYVAIGPPGYSLPIYVNTETGNVEQITHKDQIPAELLRFVGSGVWTYDPTEDAYKKDAENEKKIAASLKELVPGTEEGDKVVEIIKAWLEKKK